MDINTNKSADSSKARQLRRHLILFVIVAIVVLVGSLVVGFFSLAISRTTVCNDLNAGSLSQVILGNTVNCFSESLWRLGFDIIAAVIGVWMAIGCSGEKNWEGLLRQIFARNNNNSQAFLALFFTLFFLVTVNSAPFTNVPNFILGAAFRLGRNAFLGLIFNVAIVRLANIRSLDTYLEEVITPDTDGLVIWQGIALTLAYYFGHALLGG